MAGTASPPPSLPPPPLRPLPAPDRWFPKGNNPVEDGPGAVEGVCVWRAGAGPRPAAEGEPSAGSRPASRGRRHPRSASVTRPPHGEGVRDGRGRRERGPADGGAGAAPLSLSLPVPARRREGRAGAWRAHGEPWAGPCRRGRWEPQRGTSAGFPPRPGPRPGRGGRRCPRPGPTWGRWQSGGGSSCSRPGPARPGGGAGGAQPEVPQQRRGPRFPHGRVVGCRSGQNV